MDGYGRGQERIADHQPVEWDPAGGVTRLEASMARMGLRGAETYPERPGAADCDHYMRTGFCGFGNRCRFNHPPDRSSVVSAMRFGGGGYPERPGEPSCQFYMKNGTCKFGASCKFDHPKSGSGSSSKVPLNIIGYPLRPGESECSHYLKTGQCKFGVTCKFHHPQLASTSAAPAFYPGAHSSVPTPEQFGESSTHWGLDRTLLPGSYVQGGYGSMLISPGVVPVPGWTPYSGSVSCVPSAGVKSSVLRYQNLLPPFQAVQTFPERPGEPYCEYYLRTGECKFGSSCKYHHPNLRNMSSTNYALSPVGLPLRPGIQPCRFYSQTGYCKFGSTCKFDHSTDSMSYNLIIPASTTNTAQAPTTPDLAHAPSSEPPYPGIASSRSGGILLQQQGREPVRRKSS